MHTHKLGVTPGRCARGRQLVRVYGREGSASAWAYVGPPSKAGSITPGRYLPNCEVRVVNDYTRVR
jgi:hypothetical protein